MGYLRAPANIEETSGLINLLHTNNRADGAGVKASVVEAGMYGHWRHGMLWTIFVILLVLWLLGMVSSYTLGGYIHLLLLIAVVVLVIRLIQGRRPIM
jgi:hypothetical protein